MNIFHFFLDQTFPLLFCLPTLHRFCIFSSYISFAFKACTDFVFLNFVFLLPAEVLYFCILYFFCLPSLQRFCIFVIGISFAVQVGSSHPAQVPVFVCIQFLVLVEAGGCITFKYLLVPGTVFLLAGTKY